MLISCFPYVPNNFIFACRRQTKASLNLLWLVMDDVLDRKIVNHLMSGSEPARTLMPAPKALVRQSLWKHFRWGNIVAVSSCMICDPQPDSGRFCINLCEVSGMNSHRFQMTSRLIDMSPKKTGWPHLSWFSLMSIVFKLLSRISELDQIFCRLGKQAGGNWLKVTSLSLRERLWLHLPPECLPFFAFIVGEQLLCTWSPWVAPMLGILAARLCGLWIPEWINS